jgi:beta-galactosidase
MKATAALRACIGLMAAVGALGSQTSLHARERIAFDVGWRFQRGDVPGAQEAAFDDNSWRALDLPHDWSIEGPYDQNAPTGGSGGYLPTGVAWYRKSFVLPDAQRGCKVLIEFDGIYQHSTVWINGHELGTWPYGYTAFHYDLTPHVRFGAGPNVIAVRVDNSQQPNSRWYSGSGICRRTWLTISDPLRVVPWGTYVTTPEVTPETATVRIRTRVRNDRTGPQSVRLKSVIADTDGTSLSVESTGEVVAGSEREFDQSIELPKPRLWSPDTPQLYQLATSVSVGGEIVDTCFTPFGVRSIVYDVDRGLLLNGAPVKMRGMCLHHDGGAVGAAVPEAVLERRLRLLKEMGGNAVRASHNPMAPEFYDLCDRLGLLVMDEAFDEWTVRKPQIQFGYSDVFREWHERDLVALIHRNRNHPSIVMWSAGNEIGEQWAPEGPAILRALVEIIHREDPTRPVTAAMDNIFNGDGQAPVEFSGLLDIVGYNYVDRWGTRRETYFADDRSAFPQRRFVGTESASARGVRGEYRFGPLVGGGFRGGTVQPGNGPEGALYATGTIHAQELWKFVAMHDYVIGDFAWTGFDYLGESRWPRKLATSGALDTCGFKKDAFYFYQSIWTEKPMVHLLPHWNWEDREGKVVPVLAFTNCAVVELLLNGRSLGAKAREFPRQGAAGGWNSYALPQVRAATADLHLAWDVAYEPGELRAVGYDRGGQVVAEERIRTAGKPAALELTVDRARLAADGRDVVHVTVRALDADGVFVPIARDEVSFALAGPARLAGVDNGDPTSHERYQGDTRRLFAGSALALVQSTGKAGRIRLTARAEGLREAVVDIEAAEPSR